MARSHGPNVRTLELLECSLDKYRAIWKKAPIEIQILYISNILNAPISRPH